MVDLSVQPGSCWNRSGSPRRHLCFKTLRLASDQRRADGRHQGTKRATAAQTPLCAPTEWPEPMTRIIARQISIFGGKSWSGWRVPDADAADLDTTRAGLRQFCVGGRTIVSWRDPAHLGDGKAGCRGRSVVECCRPLIVGGSPGVPTIREPFRVASPRLQAADRDHQWKHPPAVETRLFIGPKQFFSTPVRRAELPWDTYRHRCGA